MKRQLRRLRLKQGDVIVVRDYETAEKLKEIKDAKIPACPIVVAPAGIARLRLDYLRRLIAKLEKREELAGT